LRSWAEVMRNHSLAKADGCRGAAVSTWLGSGDGGLAGSGGGQQGIVNLVWVSVVIGVLRVCMGVW